MKTVRKLIFRETARSVLLALLGFVALFVFFDFIDELDQVGRVSALDPSRVFNALDAVLGIALGLPSRVYELLPICVLIGSIFAMARLGQSCEFTVLRSAGLGPWRALKLTLTMGMGFAVLTFVVGDYIAPVTDKIQTLSRAEFNGGLDRSDQGVWLKERTAQGSAAVHVGALRGDGQLQNIQVYNFDATGVLLERIEAPLAKTDELGNWYLQDATLTRYLSNRKQPTIDQSLHASLRWSSDINTGMVTSAMVDPAQLNTTDLFLYVRHLQANRQDAQAHEIAFWRKVFYPLSSLVMTFMALPFAYLHTRRGSVAEFLFLGVMGGIGFFLLSNITGHMGNLKDWPPWLAAASPSVAFLLLSLTTFRWLVVRR
jgi:lipopolysaccharide export system permease protein